MHKILLTLFISFLISTLCTAQKTPADYVNPFIGTGAHGHTYPGATVPFGLVQLSPDTRLEGWDGCSGYHYSDSIIYGFSHTHLSGTGVPDYCDVLLMPFTGEPQWNNGYDGKKGYCSKFSHKNEKASPGYYEVLLDDYNIKVQLTATERVGMHKYVFKNNEIKNIIIDLFHRDPVINSSVNIVGDNIVEGMRISNSWAVEQYVFFSIEFSKPFEKSLINDNLKVLPQSTKSAGNSTNLKACFTFNKNIEEIIVKAGISAVSIEGARLNRETEIPHWDFDKVAKNAFNTWNKELSRIEIEDESFENKVNFYTALYHTMICPNVFNDVDGKYRGADLTLHKDIDFQNYTVFSLWDTYRAFHPLMTIIDQKRTLDYIKSFLNHYEKFGLLPVWELAANETYCMIGYHSVPVIVDAFVKGIKDFDKEKALKAMLASAYRTDDKGLEAYDKKGVIEIEDEAEGVSKTLEYSFDDWCIAEFAGLLGKNDIYEKFIKRSQYYKNVFDFQTTFMRGKSNGGWVNPFTPEEVNANYTEANSWQYSFAPIQDIEGFMKLHGGKKQLEAKIDGLFNASSKTTGRDQSDITGLIGQYAHGNEPSHHIAYLYNFVEKPWKTQEKVYQILTEFYKNTPEGLIGNEDCGQMSAWYVMSAMGFYQVTPGTDEYIIGTPLFKKVTINLENGKKFVIEANRSKSSDFYIQSVKLNNQDYKKSFLKHEDIMNGGVLSFNLSDKPSHTWGTGENNFPKTEIKENLISITPALKDAPKSFKDKLTLEFVPMPNSEIYYSIENEKSKTKPILYTKPFDIDNEINKLSFYAIDKNGTSLVGKSEFYKLINDRDINIVNPPATHYSSGGYLNLMDKIRCAPDFRLIGWLGFIEKDFEAVIDLREIKDLTMFSAGFLQDENAWIFLPTQVDFYVSNDNKNFKHIANIKNNFPKTIKSKVFDFEYISSENISARYVKVIGKAVGKCPPTHKGAGNPCWLFIDELIVK